MAQVSDFADLLVRSYLNYFFRNLLLTFRFCVY